MVTSPISIEALIPPPLVIAASIPPPTASLAAQRIASAEKSPRLVSWVLTPGSLLPSRKTWVFANVSESSRSISSFTLLI